MTCLVGEESLAPAMFMEGENPCFDELSLLGDPATSEEPDIR